MQPLFAAAPIALVLVAMVGLRWSAAAAGAAGLALALLLALTAFNLPAATGLTAAPALSGSLAEAAFAALTILWIILPALALYELGRRSGAIDRIRGTLSALTDSRPVQALLIAWFFGLFMEGAAGFGTPVALAAPLLVGLGFPPVRAVALALIGHAAGVSFGAVGTPVLTQAGITGLTGPEIAAPTALLHAATGWVLLLALVTIAAGGRPDGWTLVRTALAWACFFLPSLALATLAGPELPTLGGALLGAIAFSALLWRSRPGGADVRAAALVADLAPYGIVLALVLASRLMPPVKAALTEATLAWTLHGTFAGSFAPLYHPGTILLLGLAGGALLTGRLALVGPSLAAALRRLLPVAVALVVMLGLSRIMVHSGMVDILAEAAARTGAAWPLLAPAIGVLGTFVTGSATASNILFTDFQIGTAAALGLPPAIMAAAQSFGAAVGNVIAPHNIIAGSATVGIPSREGEVLARTIRPCLAYAFAGGLVLLAALSLAT